MKKHILLFAVVLLVMTLVAGCATTTQTPTTQPSATEPSETQPSTPPSPEGEEDQMAHYINEVYAQQIGRYYTALAEKWEMDQYYENGLSLLPYFYYEGNPLDNVGYSLVDLDDDGSWELVIGAMNVPADPAVFEIWTLVDGKPAMLAQGGTDNRYVLKYVQAEQKWHIINEVTINAAVWGTYDLALHNGKLEVVQGVMFDAFANEENPWFQTKDLDWDTSNDESIDEQTAAQMLNENRNGYAAPDYFAYASYQNGQDQPPQDTPEQQIAERVAELSQRFGVDIRIPQQSDLAYSHYDAYALTDRTFIRSALDTLEENLGLYPEGFFRQLAYGTIEIVRIELVAGLAVKEGALLDTGSVDGFAQNKGDHYLIVLNGYFADPEILFHEISHLIDARLNWDAGNRTDALFSEEAWLALQPEGFAYAMSYVEIPEALRSYLETDYFLTDYALTFPTEDRAKLMQSAMVNNAGDFAPDSGRRAKLQYYADCIRDCFDTTGWPETTAWEQVLK